MDYLTANAQWEQLIAELGRLGHKYTELEAISGERDTMEGVTHAHHDHAEPDLQTG